MAALTPEMIAMIAEVVRVTNEAAARASGGDHGPVHRTKRVDERFFRKIKSFKGDGWKQWTFQFKGATKAADQDALDLLEWAEKQEDIIDG